MSDKDKLDQMKKWVPWLGVLFFLALSVVVLKPFLLDGKVLMSSDAAISGADRGVAQVLRETAPRWKSVRLLGAPAMPAAQTSTLLKMLLPAIAWNNTVYTLGCLAAAILIVMGLLRRGLSPLAAILSGLTAFFVGSNFTLLYAGHVLKPFVILFFICSLMPVALAAAGSLAAALVWGGCVGLMFSQQPDVALFFALFSGAYFIFRLWQEQGFKLLKWMKVLVPAAVVAFLFAGGPLLGGYKQFVKGSAQMQTESKQAKWDYVTQWSFPPEEMIAFVAPGYTGWRSGEPEGPYWGRMGRSSGWEQTRQGFQNFKLENTYLGLIPVVFALFALISCQRSKHRAEILFWGGATLVALLLSFGKFSPLYSLFYKLPVVNNIRNPNKFLQVFQVCLAILTAYGFDALFKGSEFQVSSFKFPRRFFWFTVGILGLLILCSLSLTMNNIEDVSRFVAQGWPQDAAKTIAQNKMAALWHATLMAAVVAAVFALFSFPNLGKLAENFSKHWKSILGALLVLIVAADAVKLSKHYVKEMPRSYIQANALTDFLKKDLGSQRIALTSQQGIYGIWTTYLLPYNKIPTFNFSDMPRMANDYKVFLETGQRDPLNMWRFSAVKYLLGPAAVEPQLAGQARKVFSYDLAPGLKEGEFRVVPAMAGQHAVFELLNTSPRYAVTAPVEPLSDEQALAVVNRLPRPQIGSAEVLAYRPGKVTLKVTTQAPATLRIAEKYDPDWKAFVDDEPVEVQRVDYICQGVEVPAGEHEVVLKYAPSKLFFYMQCAGYLILFGALGIVLLRRKGGHAAD